MEKKQINLSKILLKKTQNNCNFFFVLSYNIVLRVAFPKKARITFVFCFKKPHSLSLWGFTFFITFITLFTYKIENMNNTDNYYDLILKESKYNGELSFCPKLHDTWGDIFRNIGQNIFYTIKPENHNIPLSQNTKTYITNQILNQS